MHEPTPTAVAKLSEHRKSQGEPMQHELPEIEQAYLALQSLAGQTDLVLQAGQAIAEAFERGNKLLICGNGGSAADSQHMAGELVSSFTHGLGRRALPALALTTDTSILTAYGNDFDFDGVFARQVEAHGQPGDILFAISTSGQSRNVIKAAKAALRLNLQVISLTGPAPNGLSDLASHSIAIDGPDTQAIQTAHLVAEHSICRLIDNFFVSP